MREVFILYSPIFKRHVPPDPHPEVPERWDAFMEGLMIGLKEEGLSYDFLEPREATDEEILAVHSEGMLRTLKAIEGKMGYVDMDTYYSPESSRVARLAAGGGLELVRALLKGKDFALGIAPLRPPGHHATKEDMMGFCLLNNVAIAAEFARRSGVERIAIYDFDLHHGNGTQDIFYHRPDVLYISTHQKGIYPGTGHPWEKGEGEGLGFTLNIPLNPGDGDEEFLSVLKEVIIPALERFQPGLLLVSAGFDSMRGDPLGNLSLTEKGVFLLSRELMAFSLNREIPIAFFLEGGYSLNNLRKAGESIVKAFSSLLKEDRR